MVLKSSLFRQWMDYSMFRRWLFIYSPIYKCSQYFLCIALFSHCNQNCSKILSQTNFHDFKQTSKAEELHQLSNYRPKSNSPIPTALAAPSQMMDKPPPLLLLLAMIQSAHGPSACLGPRDPRCLLSSSHFFYVSRFKGIEVCPIWIRLLNSEELKSSVNDSIIRRLSWKKFRFQISYCILCIQRRGSCNNSTKQCKDDMTSMMTRGII